MLVRINVNKLITGLKNSYWPDSLSEYLKFFSILYDEKAIRSGIIEREKALPMNYFATLIFGDPDLFEWMELRNHFNHDRLLYIIGSLFQLGCFAKDVDIQRLAEYILSRWRFAWDNDIVFVKYDLMLASGTYQLKPVDDHVEFYWKKACMINKYNPSSKRNERTEF